MLAEGASAVGVSWCLWAELGHSGNYCFFLLCNLCSNALKDLEGWIQTFTKDVQENSNSRILIFTILMNWWYKELWNENNFFDNWINNLFSEENKVPDHCLKLERWQGPPHINKITQYDIVLSSQGALCRFLRGSFIRRERTLCFHDWINGINKLTLKDIAASYCLILFICGGPCHLSRPKQCSEFEYLLQNLTVTL